MMSLEPPEKVRKLQEALRAKAKGSPGYRFYLLYDKICRADVLFHAYQRCRANRGAPGVDGQTFEKIEAEGGLFRWLDELAEDLRAKTYQPKPVRRAWVPKPDGKKRPLGIPTVRDRVAQMAAVLVLEPIFETDLQPEQYAYRSGRNALQALKAVHSLVNTGYREVVDADPGGYFDSIPHAELLKSVSRRAGDRHVLALVKSWLEAPVEEEDEEGKRIRTTRNRDERKGTPQGGVLSPLLANLYMRRFILGWKVLGHERRLGAKLVNYADDFVICCRGTGEQSMAVMRGMMAKLKLTADETKTRLCRLPEETFAFLGYTVGQCFSPKTGKSYIGTTPSDKKVMKLTETISLLTGRKHLWKDPEELVGQLNRKIIGWANYFSLGPAGKSYDQVNRHLVRRVRQWLCAKYRTPTRGNRTYSDEYLYETLGLVNLREHRKRFLRANA